MSYFVQFSFEIFENLLNNMCVMSYDISITLNIMNGQSGPYLR
jgi:hypothetical protein